MGGQLKLRQLSSRGRHRHRAAGDGGLSAHALARRHCLLEQAVEVAAKARRVLAHLVHLLGRQQGVWGERRGERAGFLLLSPTTVPMPRQAKASQAYLRALQPAPAGQLGPAGQGAPA